MSHLSATRGHHVVPGGDGLFRLRLPVEEHEADALRDAREVVAEDSAVHHQTLLTETRAPER